jgi:hypothetical protein
MDHLPASLRTILAPIGRAAARSILTLAWSFAAGAGDAGIKRVVFDQPISAHEWTLQEIDPALPSDWTGYS